LFFLIFFILFSISLIGIRYFKNFQKTGVILQNTKVYAGPDENYHGLGLLNISDKVKIKDIQDNWMKISNKNINGWINKEAIFII